MPARLISGLVVAVAALVAVFLRLYAVEGHRLVVAAPPSLEQGPEDGRGGV